MYVLQNCTFILSQFTASDVDRGSPNLRVPAYEVLNPSIIDFTQNPRKFHRTYPQKNRVNV